MMAESKDKTKKKTEDDVQEQVAEAKADVVDETTEEAEEKEDAGLGSVADNAELQHSAGGATTRQDATDAGVPMMQGDASEPVGPEDAFGEGEKRGDYSERTGSGTHAVSVPLEGGGEPITDDEGNVIDYKPKSKLVSQDARATEQGEVPGEKGGVTTSAA